MEMTSVRQATSRQRYALFCIYKKDYRNVEISFEEASNLINEANKDKPYTKVSKEPKSVEATLKAFITDNFSKIMEACSETLQQKSIIAPDTNYMKDNGKRYAFFGMGCAFVWIDFDKRSKRGVAIYDTARGLYHTFVKELFVKQFSKDVIKEYEAIGAPLQAIFSQDVNIQLAYYHLIATYMRDLGVKNCRANYRMD